MIVFFPSMIWVTAERQKNSEGRKEEQGRKVQKGEFGETRENFAQNISWR